MGQKVNPVAFRLGISKNDWDLRFNEKNVTESSNYFMKIFILKNFIKQFFYLNKLILHKCDIAFSNSNLHLNLSYSLIKGFPFIKNFYTKKSQKRLTTKKLNKKINIFFKKLHHTFIIEYFISGTIFKAKKKILSSLPIVRDFLNLNLIRHEVDLLDVMDLLDDISDVVEYQINLIFKYLFLTDIKKLKKICTELIKIRSEILKRLVVKKKTIKQKKSNKNQIIKYNKIYNRLKKKNTTFHTTNLTERYLLKCDFYKQKKKLEISKKKCTLIKLAKSWQKHLLYRKKKTKNFHIIRLKKKYNKHLNFVVFINSKNNETEKVDVLKKTESLTKQSVLLNKNESNKETLLDSFENNKYNLKKTFFYLNKYINKKHLQTNNFIQYFFKILQKHINGKKRSIYLTLHQINPTNYTLNVPFLNFNKNNAKTKINLNYQKKFFDNFFKFNRYRYHNFYETTLNTVLLAMTKKNSAALLVNFIAKTLPKIGSTVRHRFFLKFIGNIINCFIKIENFSKINGIQITTRGRVNQAPRKKIFTISIGKISKQKIDLKINHAKAVAQTRANGSLGVEIWINYKEKKHL